MVGRGLMGISVTPIPRLTSLTTPAFTLGTANAAGDAITAVASNSTILTYDTTLPANVGTAATGSAATAPRRDHVHGGVANISARVYSSSTYDLANASDTVILFNAERWDTDSIHSTSTNTGRLTATTAGVYVITGNISFPPNSTGIRAVHIKVNGSDEIAYQGGSASSANATNTAIATIADLDADDYVELMAYQTSGGALTLPVDSQYQQSFGMAKLPG